MVMIKDHLTMVAYFLASYDPANDPEGRVAAVGIQLMWYVAGG